MIKLMKDTFYNEKETKEKLCDFIMKNSRLSMGDKCKEFEEKFSVYQGKKYSVLLNSGSSANLALIQSLLNLGLIKKGDMVGFSALTWPTNVMPLIQLGLNPIPLDVSLENLNVNLKSLYTLQDEIKVLFITNALGFCGDLDKIKKFCDEKHIILLEDNCESLGSELNEIKLGNFGLASTFSFFVGHHLSTIEGGMVCTDDENLYNMLVMVRAHGWNRNLSQKARNRLKINNGTEDFYECYTFYDVGYNLRPTEITGFLGVEQLKYIDEINKRRNKNFLRLNEAIRENNLFLNFNFNHMSFISNFAFPVVLKSNERLDKIRDKFKEIAEIRPIIAGNMDSQPFFIKYFNNPSMKLSLLNTQKIHANGFYLPNNPYLTEEEVSSMINLLKETSWE